MGYARFIGESKITVQKVKRKIPWWVIEEAKMKAKAEREELDRIAFGLPPKQKISKIVLKKDRKS